MEASGQHFVAAMAAEAKSELYGCNYCSTQCWALKSANIDFTAVGTVQGRNIDTGRISSHLVNVAISGGGANHPSLINQITDSPGPSSVALFLIRRDPGQVSTC